MPQDDNATVPVYLPMVTVHSAIQSLREHGLPPKLDRTAWKSRSGADQTGLLSGFKFLGFIDEQGNTQPMLRRLKDAEPNSAAERQAWAEVLRQRYAKVFDIDLATATPAMVAEAIAAYGNPSASTKKRAIRFFLKTAQYAGVNVSSRLLKDLRERTPSDRAAPTTTDEGTTNGTAKSRRKKRGSTQRIDQTPPPADGNSQAMKTITLVVAGGTLTLNGTFNPFKLAGDERKLVYDIIDMMDDYAAKNPPPSE